MVLKVLKFCKHIKFKYIKIGYWILTLLHDLEMKHYTYIFNANVAVLKTSTKLLYQLSEQLCLVLSVLLGDEVSEKQSLTSKLNLNFLASYNSVRYKFIKSDKVTKVL